MRRECTLTVQGRSNKQVRRGMTEKDARFHDAFTVIRLTKAKTVTGVGDSDRRHTV